MVNLNCPHFTNSVDMSCPSHSQLFYHHLLSKFFSCTPLLITLFIMAQGNLKLKSKGKARVTKKQGNLRAAAPLIIKPKKSTAKQSFKLKKSASSSVGTEKLIASRVGHLELIKGSRRQIEKEDKEAAKKVAKKKE